MILFNEKPGSGCVVSISGPIYDYDATEFEACVGRAAGGPLDVWVNSNGGDLPAGFTIRNLIAMYPGAVTVHAIGPVHSAASVAICVKDARIIAHKGAAFMLHQCRAYTDGTARELRKTADVLDRLDDSLVSVYSERLTVSEDEIRRMLDEETWLDVDEAIRLGFVDERYDEDPDVPMMPAPDEREEDMMRRVAAEVTARFAAEVSARFSDAVGARAEKGTLVESAAPRIVAAAESVEKKFADVSARVDCLSKKCDELAGMNAKLSACLARAYALDGDEATVVRYVDAARDKEQKQEFKLSQPYGGAQ